ncbi:hypothetical protein DL765_007358 [Monosporascus sp. GIB2]|nr:hypothetical protein DL765_007358 [Monosporascus sp. GIB2]
MRGPAPSYRPLVAGSKLRLGSRKHQNPRHSARWNSSTSGTAEGSRRPLPPNHAGDTKAKILAGRKPWIPLVHRYWQTGLEVPLEDSELGQ